MSDEPAGYRQARSKEFNDLKKKSIRKHPSPYSYIPNLVACKICGYIVHESFLIDEICKVCIPEKEFFELI